MGETNRVDPSSPTKTRPILKKIARASAYALFAGVVVLILSGWGITQTGIIYKISFGLVDRRLADAIHRAANAPVAFFFLLHVMINFRLSIKSKRPAQIWIIDGALIIIGVCLMAIVVYLDYIRRGG
jgi:hypothetical protein